MNTLDDFIKQVFFQFKYNGNADIQVTMTNYYNTLKEKIEKECPDCDYNLLFKLLKQYHKDYWIPSEAKILSLLPKLAESRIDTSDNGKLAVILCYKKDDEGNLSLRQVYDMVIHNSSAAGIESNDVCKSLKERFDKVEYKRYPKGSTLCCNKVYIPTGQGSHRVEKIA